MRRKRLVTVLDPRQAAAVRDTGVEVLAVYPDTMLVRCDDAQVRALTERGLESAALPEPPVRVTGATFSFADAMGAQEQAAVASSPGRNAYYLLRLIGPPAQEWLEELRTSGAEVHGNLQGFTLLVGCLPERVAELEAKPWVEHATPYRPTMKVSPKLRRSRTRELGVDALAVESPEEFEDGEPRLIEVSVFPGEDVGEVAERIEAAGGSVMTRMPNSLVASVPRSAIVDLAGLQGIQAIVPFSYSEMTNDRARAIMNVPVDHRWEGLRLTGAGQLIGMADSGLDSGEVETIHPDLEGRVAGIRSWPVRQVLAPYTNDPPGHDDGPADVESGHGTHVAGSAAGNGAAAAEAGHAPGPAGVATEAGLFFQAIGQRVDWRSEDELRAAGLRPFQVPWPPPAYGLYGIPHDIAELFEQAYEAGARIHSNSWGAAVDGVYNQNARAVDDFMWRHPDMLILFAAGNSGVDADSDGTVDPDSIGSPGTAKNCLTVGAGENDRPPASDPPPGLDEHWKDLRWPKLGPAGHVSDDPDGMAAFSSRGPTDDLRIKPDVVAPGTNVLSLLSSAFPADGDPLWGRLPEGHALRPHYCWSGGTSMSTPLVAGAAALVREYLVGLGGGGDRRPSAALVKAFLVNGAAPMAGQFAGEVPEGPNTVSGFGRVDLRGSVADAPRALFRDEAADAVATGAVRTWTVVPHRADRPLKVTLVWTDAPSQVGADGLENRLYLRVRSPGGEVLDGDQGPYPEPLNNVQQVVVDLPGEGPYEIRVHGVSVTRHAPGAGPGPGPRQDFAVVAANAAGGEAGWARGPNGVGSSAGSAGA